MFGIDPVEKSVPDYVKNWKQGMESAYDAVRVNSQKKREQNKLLYDKKIQSCLLMSGDRVLVRNTVERGGPGKLRSHWEPKIYAVNQQMKDSPVYEIQPEKGGPKHILHRNMLLQCDSVLQLEESKTPKKKDKARSDSKVILGDETSGCESNSDDEIPYIVKSRSRDRKTVIHQSEQNVQNAILPDVEHEIDINGGPQNEEVESKGGSSDEESDRNGGSPDEECGSNGGSQDEDDDSNGGLQSDSDGENSCDSVSEVLCGNEAESVESLCD